MQKDTYDFAGKRAYHDALYRFLHAVLPNKAREHPVVCFPAHEGLEVLRVYDRLAWPRELVVGLERQGRIAAAAMQALPDVRIEPVDSREFFAHTSYRFAAANLDYQGQFKQEEVDTIATLLRRERIISGGVLATTFYGGREQDALQKIYDFCANSRRRGLEIAADVMRLHGLSYPTDLGASYETLPVTRDLGISTQLYALIDESGDQESLLERGLRENLERNPGLLHRIRRRLDEMGISNAPPAMIKRDPVVWSSIYAGVVTDLKHSPALEGWRNKDIIMLLEFTEAKSSNRYLVAQHARYSYPSGPATMHCDFLQLDKRWQRWEFQGPQLRTDGRGNIVVMPGAWDWEKSMRFLAKFQQEKIKSDPARMPARIPLLEPGAARQDGAVAAPRSLSDLKALRQAGQSFVELQQKYPDAVSRTSWAALKAWDTRRKSRG